MPFMCGEPTGIQTTVQVEVADMNLLNEFDSLMHNLPWAQKHRGSMRKPAEALCPG